MAESPVKRARANTIGDAHTNTPAPSPEKISRRIQHLNPDTTIEILTRAAHIHPDVMSMVDDAIHIIQERERNRVIGFDHYSSSVWKSINTRYRSMRGSAQYDIAFEVADDVVDTISLIAEKCGPFTNPQTRSNGLSVLRKIGKTIALSSNDTVGHEVQKRFQYDTALVDGMRNIIDSMTEDEVQVVREGELLPKLRELADLSEDYCIHPGLQGVLDLLDPEGGDEEEDDEEEDGEDYGDGDGQEDRQENGQEDDHRPQLVDMTWRESYEPVA